MEDNVEDKKLDPETRAEMERLAKEFWEWMKQTNKKFRDQLKP